MDFLPTCSTLGKPVFVLLKTASSTIMVFQSVTSKLGNNLTGKQCGNGAMLTEFTGLISFQKKRNDLGKTQLCF
jgi:hypothetical protein